MKKEFCARVIGILMILVLFSGCSTLMTVNAVDPVGIPIHQATVLVDGENIGQTPYASTRVSNALWVNPEITVTAEGYHTRKVEAVRELKVAPLIGGLFLWPVILWVWGPRATQNVVLTPEQ